MGWFRNNVAKTKEFFQFEEFNTEEGKLIVQKRIGDLFSNTCVNCYSKLGYIEIGLRKLDDKIYLAFDNGKGLGVTFNGPPRRTGTKSKRGAVYIENYILIDNDFDSPIMNHLLTGLQYRSEKLGAPINCPIKPLIGKPETMQTNFKKLYETLKAMQV